MRIDTLTIENFKSIKSLQIEFGGGNAVISGQNGTGKTSILDAVCWLLTNRMADGKMGESCNIHTPDKITVVEMKMLDGLTIRRECNGKSVYFVHGAPYNATNFKICINEIFKNAVPILLVPFNFCRLHYTERRSILLKLFASNIKVDTAKFAGIADLLKTMTPEQIIKSQIRKQHEIEKERSTIPARIDELSQSQNCKQYDVEAIQAEIESLQTQISANAEILKKLQAQKSQLDEKRGEALKLERQALQLENRLADLRAQFRANEIALAELRKLFSDTQAATTGVCPTCGNKVPANNLEQLQTKLADIVAKGKKLAEQQELLKSGAATLKDKITELRSQNREQYETDDAADELRAALSASVELREKLFSTKKILADAQRTAETQKRIEQLKAREVELGVAKSQCDKQIYLASEYIRRQMKLLEESVNQHFQFVQFQMFQPFKVAEGVKECCEPFMGDVPYAALSKGEQLKVSLDIFNALQKAYGVELPVFIDDAESYTSNSFVDLPNQIILLKAIEGVQQLQIDTKNFEEAKTA